MMLDVLLLLAVPVFLVIAVCMFARDTKKGRT